MKPIVISVRIELLVTDEKAAKVFTDVIGKQLTTLEGRPGLLALKAEARQGDFVEVSAAMGEDPAEVQKSVDVVEEALAAAGKLPGGTTDPKLAN